MQMQNMNKKALKVLQYNYSDLQKLTINHVMPSLVSKVHSQFVNEFMHTGRARVLNTVREIFVKQNSGYLIPVTCYLFINNVNRSHMTMLFEENTHLKVYEEPFQSVPYAFLLASQKFDVSEISRNFEKITGVSHRSILTLLKANQGNLGLDDIVKVRNINCTINELKDIFETNEAEVQFENV